MDYSKVPLPSAESIKRASPALAARTPLSIAQGSLAPAISNVTEVVETSGYKCFQSAGEAHERGQAQSKLREGTLGAAQINRAVTTLAAVLEDAVEYDLIARNPAKGRRRKLPTSKPARKFLEPEQVGALLTAAGELDDEDRDGRKIHRPLLATLAYAGLRIGELLALRWRDVDLASGHLHVRASKTEAGVRSVDVQPELLAELVGWKLCVDPEPDDLVFGTRTGRTGKPDARHNVRRRVLLRAVERANESLARAAGEPLPTGLSPHALRRSFASWLVAEGEDPATSWHSSGTPTRS